MKNQVIEALNMCEVDKFAEELASHKRYRVWLAGNGGSSAIVSHFASDLSTLDFDVSCLVDNVCNLTRLVNDYGWEHAYDMQMVGFRKGDVFIVASVHGGELRKGKVWSGNLVEACKLAKKRGGVVLALLGGTGGLIKLLADVSVIVPNGSAYVVEGVHSVLSHWICAKIKEFLK